MLTALANPVSMWIPPWHRFSRQVHQEMTIKRVTTALLLLMAGALVSGGAYMLSRPEEGLRVQAQLSISQALSGTDYSGFARVLTPREFSFPEDHGPHPEYAIEWWYFTGNLDSDRSRHFGFELAFFRIALGPEPRDRGSDWATSQLYMVRAHRR